MIINKSFIFLILLMSDNIVVGTKTLGKDVYDVRDYLVNNILKNLDNIKKEKRIMRPISKTIYQNGWGSCTAAATTNSMKSQNEVEYGKEIDLDRKQLWIDMGHDLSDKSDSGDYVINALKTALSNGISGYKADAYGYGMRDIREKALHIAPLITVIEGDTNTWVEMIKGEIKTVIPKSRDTGGHAVVICGYDENYVYFYNSFGDYAIKNGISSFKIKREIFYEMMKVNMLNWRWFGIYDKKELKDYVKEIELSKQIIKNAKKLYNIGDSETKRYFESIGLSNYLEGKYSFKY